jgi:hypothetical protein
MNNAVGLTRVFRNPEPFMRQIMNSPQYQNNQFKKEMADNAMDMRSKNDVQGLTDLARSVCKEKGIDFDGLYSQLKQNR